MRWMKWTGILAAVMLVIASFLPWVTIESRQITVTGLQAEGTNFGKPGYFHLTMVGLYLLFTFIPKVWAKRWNLLFVALNTGWAIRNFMVIPACYAGICPEKKAGLFIMLAASIIMLVSALFPDMKMEESSQK